MEETALVKDFAVIMVTAGAVTMFFRKLKQPPVLGYLIAGLLVGPYTFSAVPKEDLDTIRLLADLGLTFLLFGLGLEFSWSKIRQMGFGVVVIGVMEIITMISIGYGLGRLLGWTATEALFLGAALHISSSAIIAKSLRDTEQLHRLSSRIVVGILVVEDFAAVIIMTILSGVATTGTADIGDIQSLLWRLGVFVIASLVFGAVLVPRIIKFTHQFHSREALLITGLGLCFAMALIGNELGLSVAAGAFLMGALIGDTKYSEEVAEVMTPVRDMFAAFFFVTIGMLIDVGELGGAIVPILAVFGVFVCGKLFANTVATLVSGNKVRTSLRVGMNMPVMGEFSLAIAKLGIDKGAIAAPLYPVIAFVTALTSFTGPYMMRAAESVSNFIEQRSPRLVRAYVSRLEEWPQALRGTATPTGEIELRIRRSIKVIIINLLIVMVMVGAATLALRLVRTQEIFTDVRTDIAGLVIAGVLLTLCIPSFFVIWHSVHSLVEEGAAHVLSRRRSARGWRYEALRIVIRDTVLIAVIMFVMFWFVPLIVDLLSIGSYAMVLPIALFAVVLFLLFRFVRQIHTKLAQTFSQSILGEEYFSTDMPELPHHVHRGAVKRLVRRIKRDRPDDEP